MEHGTRLTPGKCLGRGIPWEFECRGISPWRRLSIRTSRSSGKKVPSGAAICFRHPNKKMEWVISKSTDARDKTAGKFEEQEDLPWTMAALSDARKTGKKGRRAGVESAGATLFCCAMSAGIGPSLDIARGSGSTLRVSRIMNPRMSWCIKAKSHDESRIWSVIACHL